MFHWFGYTIVLVVGGGGVQLSLYGKNTGIGPYRPLQSSFNQTMSSFPSVPLSLCRCGEWYFMPGVRGLIMQFLYCFLQNFKQNRYLFIKISLEFLRAYFYASISEVHNIVKIWNRIRSSKCGFRTWLRNSTLDIYTHKKYT